MYIGVIRPQVYFGLDIISMEDNERLFDVITKVLNDQSFQSNYILGK